MPFMSYVSHDQRVVKLYAAFWEPLLVCEIARIHLFDHEWLDAPLFCLQLYGIQLLCIAPGSIA